jgi:drug/metabolite transporter (DMT)-like permease
MSATAIARLRARWLTLPGNRRGALWMLASGIGFTAMAVAIKLLGTRLDNFQVAFVRILIGFLVILPIVGYSGARGGFEFLRTRHLHIHAVRALFGTIAMYCSYYALARIALADFTALSFTKPLFATVLAILILGEVVRWRRWSATIAGFLGVLIMMRPGAGAFDPAGLFALGEAFSIAFLVTLVKRLPARETTLGMLFYFGAMASVLALPAALLSWRQPTAGEWLLLLTIGTLGAAAQSFWIRAFRCGDASLVAAFDYLRLPLAAGVGIVWFSEVPTIWTVAGALVIVGSTVYIARRETQLGAKPTAAAEPAAALAPTVAGPADGPRG